MKKNLKTKPEPKKSAKKEVEVKKLNPAAAFYAKGLVKIEKETKLIGNSLVEMDRLSTSMLATDWVLGGGLVPTMYQFSGQEASGKTTSTLHCLGNGLKEGLSFSTLVDAEGTASPKYTNNIFKPFGFNVNDLLDDRSLGFTYYKSNVIERVFDNIVKRLDLMPSKIWSKEAQSWMYILPKRNDHFKSFMSAMGIKPDAKLSTDNLYYAPASHGGPEGLIAVDSWAAMLPESEEEEQEKSKRRAIQAQAFSDHLKRISAKIAEKGVILIGVNQLRKIPGQTYGDPEYEPGGEALKFFSGARLRFYSRSPSADTRLVRDPIASGIILEPSVVGKGYDRYMLKEIKNTKNKFGVPNLKTYMRVWISDNKGNPRGIDPVYDTIMYLESTKQGKWEAGKKRIVFSLKPSIGSKRAEFYNSKPIPYDTFKLMVLAEYTKDPEIIKTLRSEHNWKVPFDLRASCKEQMLKDTSVFIGFVKEEKEKSKKDSFEPEEL